jgi:hypothetical protein
MDKTTITFDLTSSDYAAALGFEVLLDDVSLLSIDHVTEPMPVSLEIHDDEGEHEFKFVMKNKTPDHTVVDENSNITKDAMLSIANIAFDDVKLGQVFVEHCVYHHDFNGSQAPVEDEFYGAMGCNGYVSLRFTTPMYLWVLENMQA